MEKISHEIIEIGSVATLTPFGLSESTATAVSNSAIELDAINKKIQNDGTLTPDMKLVKTFDMSNKALDKINEALVSEIKRAGANLEGLKQNLYSSELSKEEFDTSLTGHFANTWDGKTIPTNREQQKMLLQMNKAGFVDSNLIDLMDAQNSHPDVLSAIEERKRIVDNTQAIMKRVSTFSKKNLKVDMINKIKERMI